MCAVLFTIMGGAPLVLGVLMRDEIAAQHRARRSAERAAAFGTRVREATTPPPFKATRATVTDPTDADDLVEALERLAALHASGALDGREYRAAKDRLLGGGRG